MEYSIILLPIVRLLTYLSSCLAHNKIFHLSDLLAYNNFYMIDTDLLEI